jgi:hypothetical protein
MSYNKVESVCKEILESLFPGHSFDKVRLSDFKNPETGRSLELDLYNADLKIALEYNGPQHYMKFPKYHKKDDDFEKQKTRDLFKEEYCRIYNITLIEIPNLSKHSDIKDYIEKFLKVNNISIQANVPTNSKKICHKCGEEKTLSEFPSDKSKKGGRKNDCRDCFNAYIRGLRTTKKTAAKTPEKDQQNPVEDKNNATLNEEIVKELDIFLKKIDSSEYLETDFLKDFSKKISYIRGKHKFKPTNEIHIIEAIIDGRSDTRTNIEIIKLKLSLFLAIRRKRLDVDIEVVESYDYETDPMLIVKLPSDVILSYDEVIDFKKSLMKPKEKKLNSFEIKIEDANMLNRVGKIMNLTGKFLQEKFLRNIEKINCDYSYKENKVVISWLDEYSIEHKKMTELKDIIQNSLNMDIFYK